MAEVAPPRRARGPRSAVSAASEVHYDDYLRYGEALRDEVLGYAGEPRGTYRAVRDADGVQVYQRRLPISNINMVRAETRVRRSSRDVMEWMGTEGFLKTVDPNMSVKKAVHAFDADHRVTYLSYFSSGPIANRDFVTFESSHRYLSQGLYVTCAASVDVPDVPPRPDFVRAWISFSGFVLRQAGEFCEITYVMHGTPNGYLLATLVNLFQTKQPFSTMVNIRRYYGEASPAEPNTVAAAAAPALALPGAHDGSDGRVFTDLLEELVRHPQLMERVMGLPVVKRMLRQPVAIGGQDTSSSADGPHLLGSMDEMLADKSQLRAMLDLLISGELALSELNDFLSIAFGLKSERDRAVADAVGSAAAPRTAAEDAVAADRDAATSSAGLGNIVLEDVYMDITLECRLVSSATAPSDVGAVDAYFQSQVDRRAVASTVPALRGEWAPVTPAQKDVLRQLQRRRACNVQQFHFSADRAVDADALLARWVRLVESRPDLRTLLLHPLLVSGTQVTAFSQTFKWARVLLRADMSSGIVPPAPYVRAVDLRGDSVQAEGRVAQYMARDLLDLFDGSRGCAPMVRLVVFLLPGDRVEFLLSFHVGLLDVPAAHSARALLLDDLGPASLSAIWQTPAVRVDVRVANEYWRKRLSSVRSPTPVYKLRPTASNALPPPDTASAFVDLDGPLLRKLEDLCAARELPLWALLFASWGAVLARCSGGESKVLFGAALGRSQDGVTLGFHELFIPLMMSVLDLLDSTIDRSDADNLGAVVARGACVRDRSVVLREPNLFELAARIRSDFERDLAMADGLTVAHLHKQTPVDAEFELFDSAILYDDVDAPLQNQPSCVPVALSAVVLRIRRAGAAVDARLVFDSGRLAAGDAALLGSYYAQLLRSAASAPDAGAYHASMLTPEEVRALIFGCNSYTGPYPRELRVEALVERSARERPGRVAVEYAGREMTFSEVDAFANQFARAMLAGLPEAVKALPREEEVLVAIYLDRIIELPAIMVAAMKAGLVYLPLDPDTPRERVASILSDGRVRLVITDAEHFGRLGDTAVRLGAAVISFESTSSSAALAGFSAAPLSAAEAWPRRDLGSQQPIYVIYTSGSTGRPKGVVVKHQGVVNQFEQFIYHRPSVTTDDVVLAVSTVSFDIAQLELIMPLVAGARILMLSASDQRDGYALRDALEARDSKHAQGPLRPPVSVIQVTPATYRMLLSVGWRGDAAALSLWCGGEPMTVDLAAQLLPRCRSLWNLYGPTETTLWASVFRVEPEMLVCSSIPIGPPVINTQFFVLDASRQLVPPGVPGELCIAGDDIGSYVDPDMDAAFFVPNPFYNVHPSTSSRIFLTGDLVRCREDHASYEFIGRMDHQVKVRGFRIELEEILNVLYACEHVKECLVCAQNPEHAGGEKYLVAYVLLSDAGRAAVEHDVTHILRMHLEESLPAYMVPSYFIVLPAWPLLPNGKINRRALPPPDRRAHAVGGLFVAPGSRIERLLVDAFQETLKLPSIGIDDDFFELGGNSLLGVGLIGAVESKLGLRLPFSVVFRAATVRKLALIAEDRLSAELRSSALVASPVTAAGHAGGPAGGAAAAESAAAAAAAGRAQSGAADSLSFAMQSPALALQLRGTKPALFFVHAAFKSCVCYGALAHLLGYDQPFYGLEPRRQCASVEELAASYVDAVRELRPPGSTVFVGGWSFGCTVAYEMAAQLVAVGYRVPVVLMLDGRAPLYGDEDLHDLDALVLCMLCRGAKQYLGFGVELDYRNILPLTPDGRLLHMARKVMEKNGLDVVSPAVACGFFFHFMRDVRDSELLARQYSRRGVYGGSIVLFRATLTQPLVGYPDAVLELRTLGWDTFSPASPLRVVDIASDHEAMVFQPDVVALAEQVRAVLDEYS